MALIEPVLFGPGAGRTRHSGSYSIASAPERDRRRDLAPLMLLNRELRAGED
jgi:hypothetical protein